VKQRPERVAGNIREELATLLRDDVKDPRVAAAGLATVTEVRLSPDLRYADVSLSFIGGEGDPAAALKAIGRAAGYLRGELGRRLGLKYSPELRFHHDRSAENAERIDRLLKE
jgi:ribosome-binding factor A